MDKNTKIPAIKAVKALFFKTLSLTCNNKHKMKQTRVDF